MKWKHLKEKSCCDECGYQTKTVKIIKRHKLKSSYMGFNYPCDKWDYECYHRKQLKKSREALADEVEGCDVDKVKTEPDDFDFNAVNVKTEVEV